MSRAKPVRSRRKGGISENAQHVKHLLADLQRAAAGVPKLFGEISVRGPVYAASAGLTVVYGWGFVSTFPLVFAVGAIGVVAMGEFLKPRLFELIEDRAGEGARLKVAGLVIAAGLCVAIGVTGGVVALNAAEAPARAFQQASRAVAQVRAQHVEIDRLIDAVPAVPTNIPASRIDALGGAEKLRADRAAIIARLEARKAPMPALPVAPAVTLPHIAPELKIAVVAAVEFVIFVVPWGSRTGAAKPVSVQRNAAPAAPKTNDGGWATRIARYGPTGRKPRRKFGVVNGGRS